MVVSKSRKQRFCNTLYAKSQIGSVFCVLWQTLLLPGACFLSFWLFFGITFGLFLLPQVALGVVLEASKVMQKRFGAIIDQNSANKHFYFYV